MFYYKFIFLSVSCILLPIIFILFQPLHGIILPLSHNPDDIKFFLFSPKNRHRHEIQFRNDTSLVGSNFIANAPTIFIVPGIGGVPDYKFSPTTTMRLINAYVSSQIHGNYIGVSWKKLTAFEWNKPSRPDLVEGRYLGVIQNTHIATERIVDFICWLVGKNILQFRHVHLIGGSMGATVSALVGRRIQQVTGGQRVGRITGLDAAVGLLDPPGVPADGPSSGDAIFTDVFHSNGGLQGNSLVKQADMNIIINNGIFQPGCHGGTFGQLNQCSHRFAVLVFAASVQKPMIACECPPWRRVEGTCDHPCVNPTIVGPFCPESARGSFYLRTDAKP